MEYVDHILKIKTRDKLRNACMERVHASVSKHYWAFTDECFEFYVDTYSHLYHALIQKIHETK